MGDYITYKEVNMTDYTKYRSGLRSTYTSVDDLIVTSFIGKVSSSVSYTTSSGHAESHFPWGMTQFL